MSTTSSRGGLEVELWTDKSLSSASVDQIPLGAMYLLGTIWTRYIYKVVVSIGRLTAFYVVLVPMEHIPSEPHREIGNLICEVL